MESMAAGGVAAFWRGFLVGEGEPLLSLLIEREALSDEGVSLEEGVPLVERGLLFKDGLPLGEGW